MVEEKIDSMKSSICTNLQSYSGQIKSSKSVIEYLRLVNRFATICRQNFSCDLL